MSVRSTTLENGMVVLTDDMPHLESASLGVWVKAGARSERKTEHGISHLLEHMAFKGTQSRTALQIAEAIENVGGDLNAATSIEHTGYFARVLKDDVALAADILADILQNSTFEEDELAREKQVIVQEIGAARDNPDDHVFDLFQQAAYPTQPIGRTILGTVDSVRTFSPDTVRKYRPPKFGRPQWGPPRRRPCRSRRAGGRGPAALRRSGAQRRACAAAGGIYGRPGTADLGPRTGPYRPRF